VVGEPVSGLRIGQPLRRYVGRHGGSDNDDSAAYEESAQEMTIQHGFPPAFCYVLFSATCDEKRSELRFFPESAVTGQ
jgi:hypothetical protein